MEQSEISRIGRILKERRLQLGYTQEYAAEKAGISYSYYTKIERGQQLPSLEIAMLLSKTFRLSLDRWLLNQTHGQPDITCRLQSHPICQLSGQQNHRNHPGALAKASLVEKQN